MEDLKRYLLELDPTNDNHWTQDGQARTDVVSELSGEKVTRDMIRTAAPKFCRANTSIEEPEAQVQTSNPWEAGNDGQPNPEIQKAAKVKPEDDIKPIVEQVAQEPIVVTLPDIDGINEELAELEGEQAKLRKAIDELQAEYDERQKVMDALVLKRDKLTPAQTRHKQADDFRKFINSQIKQRQGK